METAIQKLAIISFLLVGISHLVQPRAWARFFIDVRRMGTTGSFINAFIHLPLGALIVAFHPVWTGIPTILTLMGCGWVLKGFIYFVFPDFGLKVMSRVTIEKSWQFAIAGAVLIVLGGLLAFDLWQRSETPLTNSL